MYIYIYIHVYIYVYIYITLAFLFAGCFSRFCGLPMFGFVKHLHQVTCDDDACGNGQISPLQVSTKLGGVAWLVLEPYPEKFEFVR